ncbi:MAG: hypothetical protein J0M34_07570 [Alphaproteobacteria bacterium]|nr:hypothetical protein [Alphaproteobacteria bacterium]
MVWVYAVILALSAGLITWVLSRTADRLAAFLGLPLRAFNILSYAALSALAFLTVALIPAAVAICALLLWFAGTRHVAVPISFPLRATMSALLVVIAMSGLPAPQFALPVAIPNLAVMMFIYLVWVGVSLVPLGEPSHGVLAAYGVSLALFVVGALALGLPHAIATDSLVMIGALGGAFFSIRAHHAHDVWAGNAVLLFLLGFFAAHSAYAGAWWLGILGVSPVVIYALVRRT